MDVLVGTAEGLVDAASGRTVAFQGRDVVAVAGAWAVLDGERLATLDGDLGPALDAPPITCVDSRPGPQPLVGTAEAHLFLMAEEPSQVHAFDLAEGRGQWYTPWGGPPDVRSICTAPSGDILVNVHVGGILRSDDGGANWRATIDLHQDVHQVLALDASTAVAACAYGFASSADGGATWSVHSEGLHATYSRAIAVAGETALVSASSGPGGGQAAVYRRRLASDGAFERCRDGLPEWFVGNVDTFCLAGSEDGRAALATPDGQVFVSGDEGASWEQVASRLVSVRCLDLR